MIFMCIVVDCTKYSNKNFKSLGVAPHPRSSLPLRWIWVVSFLVIRLRLRL